jgi:iron-sulfur cluster repair protein YtfE (RIC family)
MLNQADSERTQPDLVAALLDAHDRGRAILDSALRMLRAHGEDDARIAATVHRFLTFGSLQHELDEEQLVFPALRASGPQDEVEAALAHLVHDHVAFDARRDALAARWERVAQGAACPPGERSELLAATEKLASGLERHRQREELAIFPLVRTYIPAQTQAQILAVMSRREEPS